jgi:hypothetical protein
MAFSSRRLRGGVPVAFTSFEFVKEREIPYLIHYRWQIQGRRSVLERKRKTGDMKRLITWLILCCLAGCGPSAQPKPAEGLLTFLADQDVIIEGIVDPRSFEEAKPRLIARTRTYVEWARIQPKSPEEMVGQDGQVLKKAWRRHGYALQLASAVPGFQDFYQKEVVEEVGKVRIAPTPTP